MGADEALHADLDLLERIASRDASAVAALYDRHARIPLLGNPMPHHHGGGEVLLVGAADYQ